MCNNSDSASEKARRIGSSVGRPRLQVFLHNGRHVADSGDTPVLLIDPMKLDRDPDLSATVKWPNVPACYGWLSLDHRGCWRLQGQTISHAGLIRFIDSHYGPDGSGNWIFQNGPQAVFVTLDYTPLVLRLEVDGGLTTHTGVAADPIAAYLDEEGNALLHTALGIGLLDARDLPVFVAACRNERGDPAGDDALLATMAGGSGVFWCGLPLQAINRDDVPLRFGFQAVPVP